jgi:RecB family exonuclease
LAALFPSKLDTWTACPRRYQLAYTTTPPPPRRPWAHLSVGGAVHRALQQWWTLPDRSPSSVAAVVPAQWSDAGFRDPDQSARWRAAATTMVHDYVAAETARRRHIGDPVRVETVVSLRWSSTVALSGKPDRVDERPGPHGEPELVVVDYKTSRRPPGPDDARTCRTLALYAAAAEATLRRPTMRVELHHLPTGRVVWWRHDEQSRARHVSRAAAVAQECREVDARARAGVPAPDDGQPRPGPLCAWCDYRDLCPEGAAAAPAAEPWAALEPAYDAAVPADWPSDT